MVQQLVWLLIISLVVGLVWWLVDYLPVPQPLNKLIKVASMVIGFVAVVVVLLNLAGMVSFTATT